MGCSHNLFVALVGCCLELGKKMEEVWLHCHIHIGSMASRHYIHTQDRNLASKQEVRPGDRKDYLEQPKPIF